MVSTRGRRADRVDLPLKYIAGDPSLDFVNTVAWPADGHAAERLTHYARLVEWAEGAGVLSSSDGAALRRRATAHPGRAAAVLRRAKTLRSLLQRVLAARANARRADREDLDELNALLRDALTHLEIAPAGRRAAARDPLALGWRGAAEDLASPLWPVIRSAAQLLTSADAARIRMCAGRDCGWMYVDRSRNHLRRWCEMGVCGTREKSRRRAARRAAGRGDGQG